MRCLVSVPKIIFIILKESHEDQDTFTPSIIYESTNLSRCDFGSFSSAFCREQPRAPLLHALTNLVTTANIMRWTRRPMHRRLWQKRRHLGQVLVISWAFEPKLDARDSWPKFGVRAFKHFCYVGTLGPMSSS